MALADRDYYGEVERRRPGAQLTPVVKSLLILNALIFVLDYLMLAPAVGYPPILYFGAFSIESGLHHLRLWEFFTFQFIHGGFMHLLMNSIGLFFFGPWLERHLGSRHFLIYYLLCGAAGAVFYTLISYLGLIPLIPSMPLVGASAGIYGIFAGVAVIAPDLRVQLIFPPVELSMRQLAIALIVIATGVIIFNLNNAGGEAGHLGGAILGFLLMRFAPWLGRGLKVGIRPPKTHRRFESKLSPRSELKLTEDSEVDTILDKVSKEGFQSLTEAEKETLKKAAQQDRK